ncbi:MAG TPA: LuxR C-terminal-related transcriptional regulator [Flavisolibacter sp.]|nr:LuxR C-terminal-related transcriptional regulator [Flavisolibacter sp.]
MAGRTFLWIVFYGLALALLAGLMTWARYRFLLIDHTEEIYGLIIGVIFIGIGIWMGLKLSRPKTIVVKETVVQTETVIREIRVPEEKTAKADPALLEKLNISLREQEVLHFLAQGLSNEEIAGRLFVSLNTVKTHLSNLYFKLEVKRRTQAVEKARSLGLI